MLRKSFLLSLVLNLLVLNYVFAELAELSLVNLKFEELQDTFQIKRLMGIRAWEKDGINVIRLLAQIEPGNSLSVNPELFLSLHLPLEEDYKEKDLKKMRVSLC